MNFYEPPSFQTDINPTFRSCQSSPFSAEVPSPVHFWLQLAPGLKADPALKYNPEDTAIKDWVKFRTKISR